MRIQATVSTGGASTPHPLLDGNIDNDTTAYTPVAGSMIIANSSNLWDGLPASFAGLFLNLDPITGLPAWTNTKTFFSSSVPALIIVQAAAGSGALLELQDDSANLLSFFATDGRLAVRRTTIGTGVALDVGGSGTGTVGTVRVNRGDAANQYVVLAEHASSPGTAFLTFKGTGGNAIAMGASFSAGSPTAYVFTNISGATLVSIPESTGGIRWHGSSSGTLSLVVPATVTTYSLTWPSAQGGASTVLTNDGSGNLSWAAAGGSSPWQTTGSIVNLVTSTNNVTIGSSAAGGKLFVDGDTNEIQLQVQANGTQTANVQEWQNSGGTARMAVTNGFGLLFAGSTSGNLTFLSPATYTTYTVTWPAAQGGASTFLQNDGSGNLSWSGLSSTQLKRQMEYAILSPTASSDITEIRIPWTCTVKRLGSVTDTGTVTFNIEERTTIGSTGTDILSSDQVADSTGEEVTSSFNLSTLTAGRYRYLRIASVSGTPGVVSIWLEVEIA